MKHGLRAALLSLLLETAVYGPLVVVYFLLVMHLMSDFLAEVFHRDLRLYTAVSLGLLLGQAVVLDWVATAILRALGVRRA